MYEIYVICVRLIFHEMIFDEFPNIDSLRFKRKKVIYEHDESIIQQSNDIFDTEKFLLIIASKSKRDIIESLSELIEYTKNNDLKFRDDEAINNFSSVIYDLLFSDDNEISFLVLRMINRLSYQKKSMVISELLKTKEFIKMLMCAISEKLYELSLLLNILYNILLDHNDLILSQFSQITNIDLLFNIIEDEQKSDLIVKKISLKIILLIISFNIPINIKDIILKNSLKFLQDKRFVKINYYLLRIIYNLIDKDKKIISYLFTQTNYIYIIQRLLESNDQKVIIAVLLCFSQYFQNSSVLILFPYQKLLPLLYHKNENIVYCALRIFSLILNQKKIDFCESLNIFEVYQNIMNNCNNFCKQEILNGFSSIAKYGSDEQILKLLSINCFFEFIIDFIETEQLDNIKICFIILIKLFKSKNLQIREICYSKFSSLDIYNVISKVKTQDSSISNYSQFFLKNIFSSP